MLLGISFMGLQLGFVAMVAGWVMMLIFLGKYPAPADWPRDPFSRWQRFLKGDGFPAEAQPRRKLIAILFYVAMASLAVSFILFFAAGGPDALEVPPPS